MNKIRKNWLHEIHLMEDEISREAQSSIYEIGAGLAGISSFLSRKPAALPVDYVRFERYGSLVMLVAPL